MRKALRFWGLLRSGNEASAQRAVHRPLNGLRGWSTIGLLALLGCSAIAATASAGPVQGSQAGDVLVRAHILGVFPEDNSSSISTINGTVDISSRVAPEVDLSYFFTDHISAQVIATMLRGSITAKGTSVGDVKVGGVTVLPPTITAQYHFMPRSAFSPYIGAGATIFILFAKDAAQGDGVVKELHTDSHLGAALQAGFDYRLNDRWFLNLELNQIFVATHATVVTAIGTVQAKTDVDPFLVGLGLGYRF
jgi:outer membrane protein